MNMHIVTDKRSRPVSATIAIILTVLTLGYFLPWAIAASRGKSNSWAIFALNLLLGWTLIGWVVALVMSCTSHQTAGVFPTYQPQMPAHAPSPQGLQQPQYQPQHLAQPVAQPAPQPVEAPVPGHPSGAPSASGAVPPPFENPPA